MSVVTVQEYGASKNGAPKIKASGTWYFLNKSLDKPPLGSAVEIKEGSFGDSGQFKTIEAWRVPSGNGQTAPPAKAPEGYIDEASMRFISNCVGSAITSGTIKEPGQIRAWFQAAKSALEDKEAKYPFDDNTGDDWTRQ